MLIDSKGGGWGFELGRGRSVGAKASKTITRIARERLLKNRKTFAIQYMLFSLENKSDTKGQVSQKRGGSTTHF